MYRILGIWFCVRLCPLNRNSRSIPGICIEFLLIDRRCFWGRYYGRRKTLFFSFFLGFWISFEFFEKGCENCCFFVVFERSGFVFVDWDLWLMSLCGWGLESSFLSAVILGWINGRVFRFLSVRFHFGRREFY